MTTNAGSEVRRRLLGRHLWVLLGLPLLPGSVWAQSAPVGSDPDAQRQLQQQREAQQRQALEKTPEVRLQPAAPPPAERLRDNESPCFVVREVQLDGIQGWPALASRAWALNGPQGDDAPQGRCLGAGSVATLTARLQAALVDAGFVTTRVLVPPQDLAQGTLTLKVVPGRVHAIRLKEGASPQARLSNALPLQPGDLLDLRAMEQALENLQRVPGAKADVQIEPARDTSDPGWSDLVVSYSGGRDWRLQFQLDDSGSSATGRYPLSTTLSLDHALTLNDLFYVTLNRDLGWASQLLHSRPQPHPDIGGHVLHYGLPWGYSLITVTFSRSGYQQIVAGANQSYSYRGTSSNGEAKLSRVLWRNQQYKLTSWAKVFGRSSRNYIDDTEVEVQRRRVGGWELGLNLKRTAASLSAEGELSLKRGTGVFHALPAPEEAFGEGSSRLRLLQGSASLAGALAVGDIRLQLSTQWRGQAGLQALTPQDRFAIGGRYTVRGTSSDRSLSADHGLVIRNDIELPLSPQASVYLGVDSGWVAGRGTDRLAGRHLAGAVLGARWRAGGLSLDAFGGAPLQQPSPFPPGRWVGGFTLSVTP